ncbi:MAG: hypothetical protein ACXWK9_13270 [Myxococcaceae bacterium]
MGAFRSERSIEPAGFQAQLADRIAARLLDSPLADALIERVLQALVRSPALEQLLTQAVTELERSPAVDALVDRQVDRVLVALERSDAVAALVQAQASRYLQHLEAHPEQIRRIVQGQSRNAIEELTEALRGRALAADDAVDAWARRLLGRS